MNLKTIALAACCLLMPAVASSQGPMGTMSAKDSMKMHGKDSMKMHGKDSMEMDGKKMDGMTNKGKRVRGTRRSARAVEATGDMGARGHMMTGGPECARGCPTSKGVAGLTGVQFLALQQELRDRGCGNNHVTGWLDAPTRAAIRTCAQRLSVANNASAVLNALNIGFTAGS